MKHCYFIAVLLIFSSASADEYGFVGEIDLDNDGVVDRIQSGPMEMFGNGGGPIIVTLSSNGDSPQKSYLIAADIRFAVEKFGSHHPTRLWSYWHVVSSEGILTCFTFTKGELKTQHLDIYLGGTGSEIGESIIANIFKKEYMFELERVSPYTVPAHPDGLQWGK